MKLFHSLLYPLLGGLFCLSCSDDEQDSGTKQPTTAGEVTFGVDRHRFTPTRCHPRRIVMELTEIRSEHTYWI